MTSATSEIPFEDEIIENIPYITSTGEKYSKEHNRNLTEPIFTEVIKDKLASLNSDINQNSIDDIMDNITELYNSDNTIAETNKELYEIFLNEHEALSYKTGNDKKKYARIVSENPDENEFVALKQFQYKNEHGNIARFDITVFLNGFPIAVIELKNVHNQNTTKDGVNEITDYYQENYPEIFYSNVLCIGASNVIMNNSTIKPVLYGPVGANPNIFKTWNLPNESSSSLSRVVNIVSKEVLLNFINYYTIFRVENNSTVKYMARYYQYQTVEKIYKNYTEKSKFKDKNSELIFNVQGSGKSIIMQFASRKLLSNNNLKILIIIDSDNLNTDMKRRFATTINSFLSYNVAKSINDLERLLNDDKSGLIITTIQKFDDINKKLCSDQEIVTLEDEVHRNMDKKWGENKIRALDGYFTYGLTGTPNERAIQHYTDDGEFLYNYPMNKAVEEDIICKLNLTTVNIEQKFDSNIEESFETEVRKHNRNKKEILSEIDNITLSQWDKRQEVISKLIIDDYCNDLRDEGFKAIFAVNGRKIANKYVKILRKEINKRNIDIDIKPIYSRQGKLNINSSIDINEKEDIKRFKDENDKLKIVVVCEKLLTGYDSSLVKKVYVDRRFGTKSLLMQAAARTNRKNYDKNKETGEIVDFTGEIEESDLAYEKSDLNYIMINKDNLYKEFQKVICNIRNIYNINEEYINNSKDPYLKLLENKNHTNAVKTELKNLFTELDSYWSELQPNPERLDRYRKEYKTYKKLNENYINQTKKASRITKEECTKITNKTLNKKAAIGDIDIETKTVDNKNELSGLHVETRKLEIEEILNRRKRLNTDYDRLIDVLERSHQKWKEGKLTDEEYDEKLSQISQESQINNQQEVIEKAIYDILKDYNHDEIESNPDKIKIASKIIYEKIDKEILRKYETHEFVKKSDKKRVGKKSASRLYKKLNISIHDNKLYGRCIQKSFNIYKQINGNPNL